MERIGSSAYDLSAFQTKQSSVVKPNLQVIERTKQSTLNKGLSVTTVLFAVFIIAMIAATLYSNALINELGNQISASNKEYATLVSENKKLNANLECKMSLKNVETFAKDDLGLAKMEAYQIKYVNMSPEDKIEYKKEEQQDKITDKLLNSVSALINEKK